MKIIFFGNTQFSAIGEKIVHETLGIHTVVTLPDKPDKKGRLTPNPVKQYALTNDIPIIEMEKCNDEKIAAIAALEPDFFIVEDYGLILPQRLLDIPRYAPLNVHHSLLPKYRGPAPAPMAILQGDNEAGVTVIHMNKKMDAGDIYAQTRYALHPDETTPSLLTKLNELGGMLVVHVVQDILAKKAKAVAQDVSQVTYTHFMKKSDGFFTLEAAPSPRQLDRMIRAYHPWPSVWTKITFAGQEKILKFLPHSMLQVEGKNPMTIKDFYNGYPELKNTIEKLFI